MWTREHGLVVGRAVVLMNIELKFQFIYESTALGINGHEWPIGSTGDDSPLRFRFPRAQGLRTKVALIRRQTADGKQGINLSAGLLDVIHHVER